MDKETLDDDAAFITGQELEAWDVNCPQHIHKRFPQKQVAPVIEQLQAKIAELEAKLKSLESKRQDARFDD